GFTELLQNEALSDEDQNRAVKTIRRNSHYLLDVINEILELSRLESGLLEIEKLQVNPIQIGREVVDQLTEQARALNNTIHLEIEGTVPETIQTDPALLKQALVNLLTNALKLTTEGHIRLTLSCEPSQQAFCFRVSDTGMGIPTD
ncbi:MAG: ATP-binding protein, partial [Gimesia chilikensis]